MRIAFLTRIRDSASSRVRAYQWIPHLEREGHDVQTLSWTVSSRRQVAQYAMNALRVARWADVVVLLKPCQPTWLIDALARTNPHLVVDFDDASWVRPYGSTIDDEGARRLRRALRRARVVTPGSAFLADWARANSQDGEIVVIPPCIELERYTEKPTTSAGARPTIGWIGNAENFVDFIPESIDAIKTLVDDGRATFKVISSRPLVADGLDSDFLPWSLSREVDDLRTVDIGVMPLLDNVRSRGRCGYKAIQCMAVGAPVVASPVGGAREVIDDGSTGYFATSPADWVARLALLTDDEARRRAMGAHARRSVEIEFSVQAQLPRLLAAYERAGA